MNYSRVKAEDKSDSRTRRPSGFLWIMALFSPWIIYWITSGLGLAWGAPVALLISLLNYLYGRTLKLKTSGLMRIFSVAYFLAATLATFFLSTDIFMEHGGLLSYLTLFAMAALSIIMRDPFTFEVSMLDYPETYWEMEEFLRINLKIAEMWSAIFLVSGVLELLPFPWSILSYVLTIGGSIASVLIPVKEIEREFRSKVPSYAKWKPKGREVVIVGSGIGGLAAGSLLAKRGYKVTVLEQHYEVGGYCSSFRRKGFKFDVGVEAISGLGPRGPVRFLLEELGYDPGELFVRTDEAYLIGGEWFHIPDDYERFVEALIERFPEEAENLRRFLDLVREAYHELYAEVDLYGAPLPESLLYEVLGPNYLLKFPEMKPNFLRYMAEGRTVKDLLDRYFSDEKLKSLLSVLTAYLGTSPEKTPALSMLPIFGYYLHGRRYPKGGSQALSNLLAEYIRSHGGEVLLRRKVERIVVERGRVRGVVANGEFLEAPIVIMNAHVLHLPDLVGEENLPEWYISHIRSLRPSVTAFTVYLGVDMDLSSYPSAIFHVDAGMGVVITSNMDPEMAPPGHSSLVLIRLLPPEEYDSFGERGTEEYRRKKEEMTKEMISRAEEVIPGLSDHIVWVEAATPKTFERFTLNPNGAIYGLDQSIDAPERPYFKTPIEGLYLAGDSTFPGGGIEAVVISGIIAANDISGWPKRS